MNALFKVDGTLGINRYLPGQYQWPCDVTLQGAWLSCLPPLGGALVLTMEVDGTPVDGATFTVSGPVHGMAYPRIRKRMGLRRDFTAPVAAGSVVRWRASFDGAPEQGAMSVVVTVGVQVASAPVVPLIPIFGVQWVHGSEVFDLFGYDRVSRRFSVLHPELDPYQYATVTQVPSTGAPDTSTTFTLQGQDRLVFANGVVTAPGFVLLGGVRPPGDEEPCLRFCVDGVPVGTLTHAAWWLVEAVELDGPALGAGEAGYEFRSTKQGSVETTAVLTRTGLRAGWLVEAG